MPADEAYYVLPYPEHVPQARWNVLINAGLATLLQWASENEPACQVIFAAPTIGILDDHVLNTCLPANVFSQLKKGQAVFEDPEFPDVTITFRLMTLRKSAGLGGKRPVLAYKPTAALLKQIHERQVSYLVVVPWQEGDLEEWQNQQGPEPINVPANLLEIAEDVEDASE